MEGRPAVDDAALEREALAVLEANWTGVATVPAPGLYPHQWSWDSAFVAIGMARHRPAQAAQELLSLLEGQWATGMVPHIVFHTPEMYFPGPSVWRSQDQESAPNAVLTSGLTAPPMHALAVWWLWRHGSDMAGFVRRVFPALSAQHRYLATSRDLGGAGLAAIVHPWESGMDDSPAWDEPLAALPEIRYGYRNVDLDERHPDSAHDRYVWLALRYRNAGYRAEYLRDEHPFAIEDPMFNGIWLAACMALAELAPVAGQDPAPHLEQAARIRQALHERLWDGCFHARDLRGDHLIPVSTVGSFGPLLDPALPAERVVSLVEVLESARFMGATGYPVPSCEIRAAQFDRTRYWRGPSWVNTNWLLRRATAVHGLSHLTQLLTTGTLRLVRQAGFRECFDPFDGSGRGCRDFSWSAALTLDLLADTVNG
ncbi:amylo-alpha-1,6-glucosidase [Nonomuraea sp. NPDC050663]|uniref:amylo-alpha-1,6-glucosidase n=1 Tax=Nonomuraea sp. NPDC050663 TaxID=3364370 RepID=UPI00378A56D2